MYIIGLCGKAGAGKTTFANMLIDNFIKLTDMHKGAMILPYAKALKDLALSIGWNGEKDDKGRRLLQLLGTDVCRNCIDEDYWVKAWDKQRQEAIADNIELFIADDVRFLNEVSRIDDLNGTIYKLIGRAYNNIPKHESEKDLGVVDKLIDNSNTMAALNLKAIEIVKQLIDWKY